MKIADQTKESNYYWLHLQAYCCGMNDDWLTRLSGSMCINENIIIESLLARSLAYLFV